MRVAKTIKQILIYLSVTLGVLVVMIMTANIFFGANSFNASHKHFPPVSQYLAPDTKRFSVALVSDTASKNLVLERVIKDIRNSDANYSFILYLGDFVKDYLTDSNWLLWKIAPYLKDLPLYIIPGNHDVTRHHHIDGTAYRNAFGDPYYWFGYGDVLFIGLDLSDENAIDDAMLKWLSDTLRKIRPTFKYCIIYGHIPPYNPVSPAGITIDHSLKQQMADKFKAVVSQYKIDAMFFGHVHYWSSNEFAGTHVYSLPAAGQAPRGEVTNPGYVSLTIGPKGIEKVEPKYIEFSGPIMSKREAWLVNHILKHKTHRTIIALLIIMSVCMVGAVIANYIERRAK